MIDKDFSVPVVIIIYRRPETTKQVLDSLSKVKPVNLWVVGDGARENRPDEINCVAETRSLIDAISWDCDIKFNYAEKNLGLRRRVVSGLNWVFDQVDKAIILEDDCVPDQSFYYFCAELLERYANDQRIMAISGDNFQQGRNHTSYSYYFSRYPHCWGWASWRRAWQRYDDNMNTWPDVLTEGWLEDILDQDRHAIRYWQNIFQNVYDEKIDSWAYRWTLACWVESALTILPNTNLVSNIGFNMRATNTFTHKKNKILYSEPLPLPLQHPPSIIRNKNADDFTQKNHFGTSFSKRSKRAIAMFLEELGIWKFFSDRDQADFN